MVERAVEMQAEGGMRGRVAGWMPIVGVVITLLGIILGAAARFGALDQTLSEVKTSTADIPRIKEDLAVIMDRLKIPRRGGQQ